MEALRLHDEPDQGDEELPALPQWRDFAACADDPTDTFFDESAEGVAEAKRICAECPVVAECRRWALGIPGLVGVFGGLTDVERRELRASREPVDRPRERREPQPVSRESAARQEPKPCGTSAAYNRHRRRGEEACDACREAQRQKSVQAHQRRRERRAQDDDGQDVPEAA